MADWSTVASLATAGGTLVLALATFASVRSAHRAARVAEFSMQVGIRPLLMHSRLDDVQQKIMWGDQHWARLAGGEASVEIADDNIYLAMSLRNSGSGIAVIHGWHLGLHEFPDPHPHADPEEFRPQTRDLYVPGGDVGFWQAAIRSRDDPEYAALVEASARRVSSPSSCCTPITKAVNTRSGCSRWRRSRRAAGSARWSGTGTSTDRIPGSAYQ
jgi:hypothetical protein